MPSKSITTLTLLTLLTTAQTQAQTQAQTFDKSYFLGRTIQSCADVQCPTKGTTTTVSCTLTNETYTNVGVAKIPDTSGLSWVQAIVGKDLETRHFIKDFFLASNNLNVTDGGACALFFTKVSDRVKWVEGTLPVDVSQGTCAQAMSESCVRKLVERAKGVDLRGLAGEQACGKLQTEFKANLDGECAGAVAGTRWMGVEARVLSGAGAPEPITPEQNVSSNCWPVQPKSFDLTRVMRIDTTGDGLVNNAIRELFVITPILTVFYANTNTNGTAITQSEAQLTCLKAIDLNQASLANMSPGVPESAAAKGLPSLTTTGLLGVIITMLIYLR